MGTRLNGTLGRACVRRRAGGRNIEARAAEGADGAGFEWRQLTAVIAAAIGSLAAWVLVTRVMRADFVFAPGAVAGTVAACLAVTIVFGLFGTWRALGLKVAPMLRAES